MKSAVRTQGHRVCPSAGGNGSYDPVQGESLMITINFCSLIVSQCNILFIVDNFYFNCHLTLIDVLINDKCCHLLCVGQLLVKRHCRRSSRC